MKSKKILALVLVIAIMSMGAAYAVWTQKIDIVSSITSGEFAVDIIDAKVTGHSKYVVSEDETNAQNEVITDVVKISDDHKSVTFLAHKLYPGSFIEYKLTLKNNGTIGAITNLEKYKYYLDNQPKTYQELKAFVDSKNITLDIDEVSKPNFFNSLAPKEEYEVKFKIMMNSEATEQFEDFIVKIEPVFEQSVK